MFGSQDARFAFAGFREADFLIFDSGISIGLHRERLELGDGLIPSPPSYTLKKRSEIKGSLALQHEVDRSPDAMSENR